MGRLRILIADDHQSVRILLRNILESVPGWVVCGEASDGWGVILSAQKLRPDIIVMDLAMPECDGLEATRRVLECDPAVRVILTTLHEVPSFADEARRVGACGCFFKSECGRHLIPAIRVASQRRPFFTSHDLEASSRQP